MGGRKMCLRGGGPRMGFPPGVCANFMAAARLASMGGAFPVPGGAPGGRNCGFCFAKTRFGLFYYKINRTVRAF